MSGNVAFYSPHVLCFVYHVLTLWSHAQTPPVDRYLHDLLQYAFGVLHIVTSIPDGRKAIANATLSNNRAGIAVILDAANISNSIVDPEVSSPLLSIIHIGFVILLLLLIDTCLLHVFFVIEDHTACTKCPNQSGVPTTIIK